MNKIPFNQRMGLSSSKPINKDFPESARVALAHLLKELVDRNYIISAEEETYNWLGNWQPIITELLRTGRQLHFDFDSEDTPIDVAHRLLEGMSWEQVFIFCEQVNGKLLTAAGFFDEPETIINSEVITPPEPVWVEIKTVSEVQRFYSDEINNILLEENLSYQFIEGQFKRRGRAQTQKGIQRAGSILGDPSLVNVRNHYNKARNFYDERPEPDIENCVKEALCALEACLQVLTDKPASKDFTKTVRQLQGNMPRNIPTPIAEGMIKLHSYRGSGQGVAHAAISGNKVSEIEAELVLSLVASYITYLYDLLSPSDDVPF